MKRSLPFLFVPLLAIGAEASTVKKLTTRDLAQLSHEAVVGRVEASHSHRMRNGMIVTTIRLRVEEDLRQEGEEARRERILHLTLPGGTIGDLTLRVPGMPELRKGEDVVLFVNQPSRLGTCVPLGLAQGKFLIRRDAKTGTRYVSRNLGDLRLVDPKTGKVLPHDHSSREVPLEEFKSEVRSYVREVK